MSTPARVRHRATVARPRIARTSPALLAGIAALLALPMRVGAQDAGTVLELRVRDAAGSAVPLATVTADVDGVRQLRVTTDSGRVSFVVATGTPVRIGVRRIGYVPLSTTVVPQGERQSLVLVVGRSIPWSLDTVKVVAQRAVGGIVVSSATQEPIAGATISLTGGGQRVVSGADGGFALPLKGQHTVTLSVRAPGYAPAFRTERLDGGASGEFLILLDSLGGTPNHVIANLWDAERRIAWRDRTDAMVGGRELRASGTNNAQDALRESRTMAEKGLRVGDNACLFINGEPAPGQTLETFPVESVKSVELYERGGEMIGTLTRRWPPYAPCGRGASSFGPTGPGAVRYVVVWTY
jgi:hypothetical protein